MSLRAAVDAILCEKILFCGGLVICSECGRYVTSEKVLVHTDDCVIGRLVGAVVTEERAIAEAEDGPLVVHGAPIAPFEAFPDMR